MCMGGGGGGDQAALQAQEEEKKEGLRARVNAMFAPNPAFETEEAEIRKALTGQYTDELGDLYKENERKMRFGGANTGNVGNSVAVQGGADLSKQNQMGSTRIGEAVTRAINSLRAGREDSRLRSLQLINSGSGEDAVAAASAGLRGSLDNARSASRERLFDDLFSDVAFTKAAGDASGKNDNALAYFQQLKRAGPRTALPESGGTIIQT